MGRFYHSSSPELSSELVQHHTFLCGSLLDFDILCSTDIILLELGWLHPRGSILSFLSVGLFEHPTRHITTFVVTVIVITPAGPSSSPSLVFSLLVLVWQHLACTSQITNYHRILVHWGADTNHFAMSFVVGKSR